MSIPNVGAVSTDPAEPVDGAANEETPQATTEGRKIMVAR